MICSWEWSSSSLTRSILDLLKNKTRPEAAAYEADAWVISERDLREKLKKEKAAKEAKEKVEVRTLTGLNFSFL